MRALIVGLFVAVLGFSGVAAAADPGDAIVGTWLTNDGSSKVQISNVQGVYGGQVVWLKEPRFPADDRQGMAGQPKVDRLNPDAALRNRPVMGLAILTGLHFAGGNSWNGGTIYSPANGKSFPCKLTLAPDGTLNVSAGGSVFGRTVVWTRG
ncbi:MAG: DUF2147 domain-containing protein [Proteobacteria bacterium]|nr:DUF2147 domain-containing protein [Pseudomonadota bacterium]